MRSPFSVARHFGNGERAAGFASLAIFLLATAILAAVTFARATTPWSALPDADYWGNIWGLITESGVTLDPRALFRHNNEHLVVIPKLIYVANYLALSGSNIGLILYSIAAGAACAGLLLLLAWRTLGDTPWRLALCAALFPIVMFSAKLTHSYFYGMSGAIWLTADLFVIGSAAALARLAATGGTRWLFLSLFVAILGALTYSTALYMLLVVSVFCAACLLSPLLCRPVPRVALIATLLAAIGVLGVAIGYSLHSAPNRPPVDVDLSPLPDFVLTYLGSALAAGPWRRPAGLALLAAGAVAIVGLVRAGRGKETLLWSVLFFFAPFNAVMTGFGRLSLGVGAAAASRYQSVMAISLIATIVLVLAALPKGRVPLRAAIARALALAVLVAVGIALLTDRSFLRSYTARNAKKAIAEIALRQEIPSVDLVMAVTPAVGELERILPALRATRHVPFDRSSRCEAFIGQKLPAREGRGNGGLDAASAYPKFGSAGDAVALSGWAERDGVAAECILIADGEGVGIGAGASVLRRPALKHVKRKPSERVGWKAVARLPRSGPVCAFALFPGDGAPAKLSPCRAPARSAPTGG